MKLGAYFLPVAFDSFLHSVETADRVGYSNAWVCDSQMIWQDPYVYMARGLAATEKLVFGTAVTNPITRHPTVTASGHATLADMHPGRVVLGIGRGDSAIRTLGLSPARIRDMEAVVPRIRDLLDGKAVNFGERDVRITFAGKPVPIMLGGSGPRTPEPLRMSSHSSSARTRPRPPGRSATYTKARAKRAATPPRSKSSRSAACGSPAIETRRGPRPAGPRPRP